MIDKGNVREIITTNKYIRFSARCKKKNTCRLKLVNVSVVNASFISLEFTYLHQFCFLLDAIILVVPWTKLEAGIEIYDHFQITVCDLRE